MQADELGALLRRYDLRTHVNLIPWNAVAGSPYERPSNNAVHRFADALRNEHRVPTSIRVTRGTASVVSERHDLALDSDVPVVVDLACVEARHPMQGAESCRGCHDCNVAVLCGPAPRCQGAIDHGKDSAMLLP